MKKQEQEFELFKFETNIPEVTKNESGQLTGGFIDIATIVCNEGGINKSGCEINENCGCLREPCQLNEKDCVINKNCTCVGINATGIC